MSAGVYAGASEGGTGVSQTPPIPDMTTLLTIKQVAAWLNMRPSTLYAWAGQQRIPSLKIHGLLRFEPHAIEQWLVTFRSSQTLSASSPLGRRMATDVDMLIAAAKRDVYTSRHGETRPKSSLIGKEEADGASETK